MFTEERANIALNCLLDIQKAGASAEKALNNIMTDKQTTLAEHYENLLNLGLQLTETIQELEEIERIVKGAFPNNYYPDEYLDPANMEEGRMR